MDNFLRAGLRLEDAPPKFPWFGSITQGALVGTVLTDKLTTIPPAGESVLAALSVTCAVALGIQLLWSILRVRGLDVVIFSGRTDSVYIVGWRSFKGGTSSVVVKLVGNP